MSDIIKSKEVDGVEMCVLADGTPFLTRKSLARLCGVSSNAIKDWGDEVPEKGVKLRAGKMAELLTGQGFQGVNLYKGIVFNGVPAYAYSDVVSMAFLEYYAFEADDRYLTKKALNNYRILARKTLRDFIYMMVGYDPQNLIPSSWQHFHDRMLLNPVPSGYYSVFKEIANIVISAIQEGLIFDAHTIPDISVGLTWSTFWKFNGLKGIYGSRTKYPHEYPPYFPQSLANVLLI